MNLSLFYALSLFSLASVRLEKSGLFFLHKHTFYYTNRKDNSKNLPFILFPRALSHTD